MLKIVSQVGKRDSDVNIPGHLEIADGKFRMENPQGYGAWPVVIPGENVELYYRHERIEVPTVIDDARHLQVIVPMIKPESSFELVAAHDKLEVKLITRFRKGEKYQLCDAPPAQKLTVKAQLVETIDPEPIAPVLVLQELENQGIVGNILYEQIAQACSILTDQEVVIVTGTAPRQPVDGRVEIICELESHPVSVSDQDRIDYREQRQLNSVEIGDVLAVWHPPIPGVPGRDVYGAEVPVRAPRKQELLAGRGVKLINNGRIAAAQIPGRPVYRSGVLSISQQVVVEQDVSIRTGNIRFKGDVLILGNVHESMEIEAGGIVDLKSSCYHARIDAGSHVRIGRKLIGGIVTAGIMQPGLMRISAMLGKLREELLLLETACVQMKEHCAQLGQEFAVRGDGYFIKLLLERRFSHTSNHFKEVRAFTADLIANQELMSDNEEFKRVVYAVNDRSKRFLGLGPLSICSFDILTQTADLLDELKNHIDSSVDSNATITAGYCQNAYLEASGSIEMRGPLIYSCTVSSGAELVLGGECRCGSYYAKSSITAQTVGSGSMAETKLAVGDGGYIRAAVIHPTVEIKIGSAKIVIQTKQYNQEFRVDPETGLIISRRFS